MQATREAAPTGDVRARLSAPSWRERSITWLLYSGGDCIYWSTSALSELSPGKLTMFGFGKRKHARENQDPLAALRKSAHTAATTRNPKQRTQALAALSERDRKLGALALVEVFVADTPTPAEVFFDIFDTFAGNDEGVRYEIVSALGAAKSHKATPYLIRLLSDPEPWLRQRAIAALASIGDLAAIRPLIQLLQDQDYEVVCAAVRTLAHLAPNGDHEVGLTLVRLDFLRRLVNEQTLPTTLRAAAARQLGVRAQAGDQECVAALRTALASSDPSVKIEAKVALEKLGETVGEAADASVAGDFYDGLVGRAIDITRQDWVGVPPHVNPATCSGADFVTVTPGTYAVQRVERVEGQPWLVIVQGGATYKIDGGDFRAHWPAV